MAEAQPSEELRAFMLRLYEVWGNDDFDALREMFTGRPHLLIIGTDPNEWWTGPQQLDLWEIQNKEMGGAKFTPGKLTTYAMGNFGWIADDATVILGNGAQFQCRVTAVVAIERGHWRIVHWHASVAQRNEDTVGLTLTTSIEKLEKSVQEDRPNLAPASAPDGTVTIAFTDIESSTVMMERIGDTAFLRLLAWHDGIVRAAAAEHRGFVVKSQGDGFMLAFSSAALALRAILVMRQRMSAGYEGMPVRIRSGLHSGEAIKQDDDFYGRTVVIAARISGLALGGEILASDLVYALARSLGTFTFGESRRSPLKGLEGTFEFFPVLN